VPGATLSPFRGHKDCLDIETVLGGFVLANAPNFIDYGVPRHELFSHEFFRCADNRAFTRMLSADQDKCFGIRRIRNVHAIPGYQEIHSVHGCDGDMRSDGGSLARDLAGGQNAGC